MGLGLKGLAGDNGGFGEVLALGGGWGDGRLRVAVASRAAAGLVTGEGTAVVELDDGVELARLLQDLEPVPPLVLLRHKVEVVVLADDLLGRLVLLGAPTYRHVRLVRLDRRTRVVAAMLKQQGEGLLPRRRLDGSRQLHLPMRPRPLDRCCLPLGGALVVSDKRSRAVLRLLAGAGGRQHTSRVILLVRLV